MSSATNTTDPAFGSDLSFTRQNPRAGVGGVWVMAQRRQSSPAGEA